MEYVVDKKWKWVQCNLVIKRLAQKDYRDGLYQSLQAQVQLISEEPDIRNFQSDVIMQKTFQFEQGKGFFWHKSWNIPQIVIKLSSKITRMLKDENYIKKMYCQMLAGYPFKKDQHYYLEQVKLDGDTVREFTKKGQVSFSNIKFSETSFNKNRNKFSLILVIYTSYKQTQKSIIKSYISSPIHVDSRKEARKKISANTFIQDQISVDRFLNGLQGAQKLVSQCTAYEQLLTIQGFIRYYTAANIRYKIKHPYYIGYHFHNVFDVYYNSEQAQGPVEILNIIYENQLKQTDRAKIKPKPKKQMFTDNKEILKKACPKILLFLIKNTPKQCYAIKQQTGQSQQKIVAQSESKLNIQQSENKVKLQDSPQEQQQKNVEHNIILMGNGSIPVHNNRVQTNELDQSNMSDYKQKNNKVDVIQKNSSRNSIKNNQVQKANQPANKQDAKEDKFRQQSKILQLYERQQKSNLARHQRSIKEEQNSSLAVFFEQKIDQNGQVIMTKRQQLKFQLMREQDAVRKIYSIFESWKFNFIHLKKSDGGLTVINKKWVRITFEQLLESFKIYSKKKDSKVAQNSKQDNRPHNNPINNSINTVANSYLSYEIHQVIVLQKSKHSLKIEGNNDNYPS